MTDCTSVTRLEYTLPKIVSNMYSGHRVKENEIWKKIRSVILSGRLPKVFHFKEMIPWLQMLSCSLIVENGSPLLISQSSVVQRLKRSSHPVAYLNMQITPQHCIYFTLIAVHLRFSLSSLSYCLNSRSTTQIPHSTVARSHSHMNFFLNGSICVYNLHYVKKLNNRGKKHEVKWVISLLIYTHTNT